MARLPPYATAAAGGKVVISSLKDEACEAVAREIREAGGEALAVPYNMTHLDRKDTLATKTLHHFGRIDSPVLNAAVNPISDRCSPLMKLPMTKSWTPTSRAISGFAKRACQTIVVDGGVSTFGSGYS